MLKLLFLLISLFASVNSQSQRECACNMKGLYLDVAAAIDFSTNGDSHSIIEAISDVATVFINTKISQSRGQFTRVALGSFDSTFNLTYGLSYFGNTDEFEYDVWGLAPNQTPTSPVSNLTAALIGLQQELFNKDRNRENIVSTAMIFATTYTGDANTLEYATNLKSYGIKIIVNSMYSGSDPSVNANLAKVASPGMLITKENSNTVGGLESALCLANCYCPNGYDQYIDTSVEPPHAYGECASVDPNPIKWQIASNVCSLQNLYLATAFTLHKIDFLAGLAEREFGFAPPHSFWVGLYKDNEQWKWIQPNGSSILANTASLPWLSGYPSNNNTDCAEVAPADSTEKVFGLNDLNSYQDTRPVACEIVTCDTMKYCDT